MTDWSAFAGITGVVLTALLALARLSQAVAPEPTARATDGDGRSGNGSGSRGGGRVPDESADHVDLPPAWEHALGDEFDPETRSEPRFGPTALLANVAVSQGGLGALLIFGVWYAAVPPSALGLSAPALGLAALLTGIVAGVVLYLANEGFASAGRRVGLEGAEAFRTALAPESRRGWAVLLLIVLPVVAVFEELLFRGALVGGFAVGFGISPWLLAGLSSVAFAVGHGAQGRVGMAVTGVLGFALAALFVVTESLLVVVVAHYLVNALEFVVNESRFGLA